MNATGAGRPRSGGGRFLALVAVVLVVGIAGILYQLDQTVAFAADISRSRWKSAMPRRLNCERMRWN